ncbi:addiction module antidote protein, HigA family [Nesterenkonia halobia]|uniref:HigA family addiction module antitoxin n=1 Tax=Nesterenkonia halobia TaxID=37922 RepID=A0ABP6RFC4_9MICC
MSTTHLIHPGVILRDEFLEPLDISADTAVRPARCFGTSEAFWMNLQSTYDLSKEHADHEDELQAIQPLTLT